MVLDKILDFGQNDVFNMLDDVAAQKVFDQVINPENIIIIQSSHQFFRGKLFQSGNVELLGSSEKFRQLLILAGLVEFPVQGKDVQEPDNRKRIIQLGFRL